MKRLICNHSADAVQTQVAPGFFSSLFIEQRLKTNTKNSSAKRQRRESLFASVFSVLCKGQDTNARLSKKFILEMVLMLYPTANTFSPLQVS